MKSWFRLVLILLLVAAAMPLSAVAQEVVVYNWTEYLPAEVIDGFTKETGIRVSYATYESNEAMYAKVKLLKAKGYDIVVPSSYFVDKMRREELLLPLEKKRLPNLSHLDPALLDKPYDPKNRYSVPYMWGGTGILYHRGQVALPDSVSWAELWNPKYKGKVLLQDDLREVFGIALLLEGRSVNERNSNHIRNAYKRLKSLIPSVRLFNSDNPKVPFLNEEVSIGMIWNGEAVMAMEENPKLHFVWPKEGGIFWTDCLCIPKGAPNPENAHRFMDYLMRPDVAAKIASEIGYATPNKTALAGLPDEIRNNPVAYPPAEVLSRSQFQKDVGEAIVEYEKYWGMLKTGP